MNLSIINCCSELKEGKWKREKWNKANRKIENKEK